MNCIWFVLVTAALAGEADPPVGLNRANEDPPEAAGKSGAATPQRNIARIPMSTVRRSSDGEVKGIAPEKPSFSRASGPCDAACDYCWCGSPTEQNCPIDWFYDADCDCGCQFCDPICPDCFVQDCGSSPCPPACDYCWIDTQAENNCPNEWCNDGDCDCGCQWEDQDCGGPPCGGGCNPVCGDGVCECECNETVANCETDCVDAPCADGPVEALCSGDTVEICARTFTTCPCEFQCDWCWEANCDPAWLGDGECDCGCQYCDPDCPEFPNCCIAGPAPEYVRTDVFPPACGTFQPSEGWSVFDSSLGEYVFCSTYLAGSCEANVCSRFWLDYTGACDPEIWWRFYQNAPSNCCVDFSAIIGTDPPNCAIDARQPFGPDGAPICDGWNAVTLFFAADVSCASPFDFSCRTVPNGPTPAIVDVLVQPTTITIQLDTMIPPGRWTCVGHTPTGQEICMSSLPGDADNDGISAPVDLLHLIDCLHGLPGCELWHCDTDCSGRCHAPDVLRLIDLLGGASPYTPWLNATLPLCPALPN